MNLERLLGILALASGVLFLAKRSALAAGKQLNIPDRISQYIPIVRKYARIYGVPEELIYAIILVESNGDPNAIRLEATDTSLGLTQILYGTARGIGYTGSPKGLFDPETNIHYGVKYLSRLAKYPNIQGDTTKMIAGYNAGPDLSPWPEHYVNKVKAWLERLRR